VLPVTRRVAAAAAAVVLLAAGTVAALTLTARADPAPAECTLTAGTECELTLAVNTVSGFSVSVIGEAGLVQFKDGSVTCNGQLVTPSISSFDVNAEPVAADSSTSVWSIGDAPPGLRSSGVICTLSISAYAVSIPGNGSVTVQLSAQAGNPSSSSPSPSASASASAPASGPAASAVHLVRGFDGTCVRDLGDSAAPRTKVVIWACDPAAQGQGWTYRGDELRIHGSMCVNAKGRGSSGSPVILWKCNGGPNEIWIHRSDGEYVLKAGNYQQCLTDPGFSVANGKQIVVATCADARDQHWSLP
jgi:alpha-galactosidase